jgi:hypothetical protein
VYYAIGLVYIIGIDVGDVAIFIFHDFNKTFPFGEQHHLRWMQTFGFLRPDFLRRICKITRRAFNLQPVSQN